ncbi:MAG: arylesterase [Pseudomonadota bacterium]
MSSGRYALSPFRPLWRVALLCWPLLAAAGAARAGEVLILGDSLSAAYGIDRDAGWVALLEDALATQCPGVRVHNASVSGETSAGGLQRLPELLDRRQPRVVVIELGGNDGLRALPPNSMAENLAQMVRLSRAAGAEPVLLGMRIPPNYGPLYQRRFERAFAELARRQKVPFAPFFLAGLSPGVAHFQADGIHPTAAAQPQLLRNAWPPLAEALAGAGVCAPDPRWASQPEPGHAAGG